MHVCVGGGSADIRCRWQWKNILQYYLISWFLFPYMNQYSASVLFINYHFWINILLHLTFRDCTYHLFALHLQLVAISSIMFGSTILLYPIGAKTVQFLFLFFAQKISVYLCSYLFTTIPYTNCPWNTTQLGVWC